MSVPGLPRLNYRVKASQNTLEFFWQAPLNDGGQAISSYTLLCSSIPYSTVIGASTFYAKASTLTNTQNYVFQLAATNAVGTGPFNAYRIAQPGSRPAGVTNLTVTTLNGTTANVAWSFSNNTGEATNKFFALSLYPSTSNATVSSFTMAVYPNQRSQLVTNLSTMYYNFVVQSINDAGYSFPNVSTLQLVASLFSPSLVTGLQAWLDGSDPNGNGTAGSNGAGLSTWYDKSGNSRNMSITGSGITYANGAQNSLNAISLNGTNQGTIVIPTGTFSSNYCGFIVFKNSAGNQTMFGRTDSSGWALPFDTYGDQRYSGTSAGNRTFIGLGTNITTAATSTSLWNFTLRNYAATGGSGSYNEYFNGSSVSVTGGQTTGLNAADTIANIYFIGRAGVAVNTVATYHEILIYNSNLSNSDRQKIEGYLAWKWGIQSNLPGAHPYSGAPPNGS